MEGIPDRPQTIIRLEASNVKRLKAVSVSPNGELVIVSGANAQGKSSLLDSVAFLIGGKKMIPSKAVREGQERFEIVGETQDLYLRRTGNISGGGTFTMRLKSTGDDIKRPQNTLDAMIGKIAFDPSKFIRMKSEEQAREIRAVTGIDLDEIDTRRAEAFENRRRIHRDLGDAQARLNGLTQHRGAPKEEQSSTDVLDELDRARQHNQSNADKRKALDEMRLCNERMGQEIASQEEVVFRLEQELDRARQKLTGLRSNKDSLIADGRALRDDVKTLADIDESGIRAKLDRLEEINNQVRDNREYSKQSKIVAETKERAAKLTQTIKECDDERTRLLSESKMPIDGLSIDTDGIVTYHGISLSQCSSAEQLRIAVAIGFAQNPQIKVLLVREGSLLDDNSLQLLSDLAAEFGGQVWIEMVGKRDDATVIIEDGMVRSD